MACTSGIAAAVTSNCTSNVLGGIEAVAYVFNRADMTLTFDGTTGNKITNIAKVGAAVMYKLTGFKRNCDFGHDLVAAENQPDRYTHFFSFPQYERLVANILNVDNVNDVVVVVETINKGTAGDGTFFVLGAKYGLWKTSDSRRINADGGQRTLELQSMAGMEEPYSAYVLLATDYATTKALLEGLD
jgi:hypothetical protein